MHGKDSQVAPGAAAKLAQMQVQGAGGFVEEAFHDQHRKGLVRTLVVEQNSLHYFLNLN